MPAAVPKSSKLEPEREADDSGRQSATSGLEPAQDSQAQDNGTVEAPAPPPAFCHDTPVGSTPPIPPSTPSFWRNPHKELADALQRWPCRDADSVDAFHSTCVSGRARWGHLDPSSVQAAIHRMEASATGGMQELRYALFQAMQRHVLNITVFGTSMTYGMGCAIMNKDLEHNSRFRNLLYPEEHKPRRGWSGRLQLILESGLGKTWKVNVNNQARPSDKSNTFSHRFSIYRGLLEQTDLVIFDFRINDDLNLPNAKAAVQAARLIQSLPRPPAVLFLETFSGSALMMNRTDGLPALRNEDRHGVREQLLHEQDVPVLHYADIDLMHGGPRMGSRGPELWPAGDNPSRKPPITEFPPHPTCVVHEAIAQLLGAAVKQELPERDILERRHPASTRTMDKELSCLAQPLTIYLPQLRFPSTCADSSVWKFKEDVPLKPGWIAEGSGKIAFRVETQMGIVRMEYLVSYEHIGNADCWLEEESRLETVGWRHIVALNHSLTANSYIGEAIFRVPQPGRYLFWCLAKGPKFKIVAVTSC